MESMKDKTAIVGVGYTPQGKVPSRSSMSFHAEAARNAIEDARCLVLIKSNTLNILAFSSVKPSY